MVKFIGEYDARLDDKGRVVVPSAFKSIVSETLKTDTARLDAETDGADGEPEIRFVIKKDLFADCLNMFTYEQWDKESEQVRSRLNLFRREDAAWYREYMTDRALVTLDRKVGRIIIPKPLLAKVGIVKDVVFAGNDYKIEIWSKESYGKNRMSEEEFSALTEKLLG